MKKIMGKKSKMLKIKSYFMAKKLIKKNEPHILKFELM